MPEPVTDRDMIVQLAKFRGFSIGEKIWCGCSVIHGTRELPGGYIEKGECPVDHVCWNPLTNTRKGMADALELEGMVPEEKRERYKIKLRLSMYGDGKTGPIDIEWALLRRTPRQISTAVFSVMCQEAK